MSSLPFSLRAGRFMSLDVCASIICCSRFVKPTTDQHARRIALPGGGLYVYTAPAGKLRHVDRLDRRRTNPRFKRFEKRLSYAYYISLDCLALIILLVGRSSGPMFRCRPRSIDVLLLMLWRLCIAVGMRMLCGHVVTAGRT